MPFVGPIGTASVVILMLNPELSTSDYFGEFEIESYRKALRRNLKTASRGGIPNLFLDPAHSWHSGFRYWHDRKLGKLIDLFTDERGLARADASGSFFSSCGVIGVDSLPLREMAGPKIPL